MTAAVQWVHDDCLQDLGADAAIYVFDDEKLKTEGWGIKRIGFIYECLLELAVEIRRGDPVCEVLAFAEEHRAQRILAYETSDPRLQRQLPLISKSYPVEMIKHTPFVDLPADVKLERFSKYWAKAEKQLIGDK